MKARVVYMEEKQPDIAALKCAGRIIRIGGLVAFPTETVYGVGGNALDTKSVGKIYEAKGRASDNPLTINIADFEDIYYIVGDIPEEAKKLAKLLWPGPLTMIFKKKGTVPTAVTGRSDTVAVRIPANEIARAVIRAAGGYVAAPSANISGRPSPTKAEHVINDLGDRVDMIIDS